MKSTSPVRLALLAAAVTVLLWASAFVVIRFCGAEFSPGAMAFIRLAIGTIALTAVAAVTRPRLPRGRGLVLVIGYGVLWFAAYTVVLNWAEQHLDAGTSALLVNFAPFLTWAHALNCTDAGAMAATALAVPAIAILLSWLILGEVPTMLGFVGARWRSAGWRSAVAAVCDAWNHGPWMEPALVGDTRERSCRAGAL